MQGRDFLQVARELQFGATEAHWRAAVVKAYYGLLWECRTALKDWGRPVPPKQNVHSFVRLQFVFASDADLKRIGDDLEKLVRSRNQASLR